MNLERPLQSGHLLDHPPEARSPLPLTDKEPAPVLKSRRHLSNDDFLCFRYDNLSLRELSLNIL